MFSRFSRTPTCDGLTDRRTDGHRVMASTADASHRAVKNDDDDNGNNDEVNWA